MARLIIGANELLPGTQVITESGVTITPKDGLEVLLAIDDVIPASVTLDSGTSLSQKVHVMNKSGNACTLIYTSQNGTSSIALNTNQAASLVWTGDHWNATFSGLITGTDADGNSINYDTDITLDVAPRSRDDYSTSEIFTGQYWIDGKKIYRKVITGTVTTYTDSGSKRIFAVGSISSADITDCIRVYGNFYINNGDLAGYYFVVPLSFNRDDMTGDNWGEYTQIHGGALIHYIYCRQASNSTSITAKTVFEYVKNE